MDTDAKKADKSDKVAAAPAVVKVPAAAEKAVAAPAVAAQQGGNTRLHVGHLTRNVTEAHMREIFGSFGKVREVELAVDRMVNLPRCACWARMAA